MTDQPDYDETGRVRRELTEAQRELEDLLRRYVFGGDIAETFLCGFGPLTGENKAKAELAKEILSGLEDAIGRFIRYRVLNLMTSTTLNSRGDKRITSSPLYDWWNEAQLAIRFLRPPVSCGRTDWTESHTYSREIERRMPGTKAHAAANGDAK